MRAMMQFRSALYPFCHLCVHIARSLAAPSIGHGPARARYVGALERRKRWRSRMRSSRGRSGTRRRRRRSRKKVKYQKDMRKRIGQ
eukprot:9468476-Pyramimonas_sp.AAC.1